MEEKFSYKGKDYRVDDKGVISEDKIFGSEVGKKDKDGNITIHAGIFTSEEARISKSGDVYEKGLFGGDKEKVGEAKSACILSSACITARGLPDDCDELTILRKFREDYLEGTARGNSILQEYQNISGQILQWIDRSDDRLVLYNDLYRRLVRGTVDLLCLGQIEAAINHYRVIVREYQRRALAPLNTISTIT